MKKTYLTNKYLFIALGVLLGAIIGFVYWQLFGYQKPPNWLVSSWTNDVIYSSILGGLTANIIRQGFFSTHDDEFMQET